MLNVRGVKDVRALQKIAVEETRLGIPLIFGFDVIHGYKTIVLYRWLSPQAGIWASRSANGCRGGFRRWIKLDFTYG
jgi:beta-glucosidase-like glycosyl hydrolase